MTERSTYYVVTCTPFRNFVSAVDSARVDADRLPDASVRVCRGAELARSVAWTDDGELPRVGVRALREPACADHQSFRDMRVDEIVQAYMFWASRGEGGAVVVTCDALPELRLPFPPDTGVDDAFGVAREVVSEILRHMYRYGVHLPDPPEQSESAGAAGALDVEPVGGGASR